MIKSAKPSRDANRTVDGTLLMSNWQKDNKKK